VGERHRQRAFASRIVSRKVIVAGPRSWIPVAPVMTKELQGLETDRRSARAAHDLEAFVALGIDV